MCWSYAAPKLFLLLLELFATSVGAISAKQLLLELYTASARAAVSVFG